MDQRGIGNWDMQPLQTTEEAVWAMDSKEADYNGWVRTKDELAFISLFLYS
jgi:hypothetical protein